MSTKKALIIWAVALILWLGLVGKSILPHYAPILSPSEFVYIPMVKPVELMEASDAHHDLLTRTRLTGNYWIDSFGIEGVVKIDYLVEITSSDEFRTWMPHKGSFASFPLASPGWLAFRQQLVSQAMDLRNQEKDRVLKAHVLKDALLLLGVPLVCLVVIFGYRANASLFDRPARDRFPDL